MGYWNHLENYSQQCEIRKTKEFYEGLTEGGVVQQLVKNNCCYPDGSYIPKNLRNGYYGYSPSHIEGLNKLTKKHISEFSDLECEELYLYLRGTQRLYRYEDKCYQWLKDELERREIYEPTEFND